MFLRKKLRQCLSLVYGGKRYRQWYWWSYRYRFRKRYCETGLSVDGHVLKIADTASFLYTWKEIFVDEIYRFSCSAPIPVILDLGANIGLSVLYFKRLFPACRIYAYEPDPYIFEILQRNVTEFHLTDVALVNEAVAEFSGELGFKSDHADGGCIRPDGEVKVKAKDIRLLLERFERIDFLKVDIEGAERMVIPAAGQLLQRVENIFVEYHSRIGEAQLLAGVIETLESAGFRLVIQSAPVVLPPLAADLEGRQFDTQLSIWGKRQTDHGRVQSSLTE